MIRKNCNTKWSPKTKPYSKDAETCSTLSHHPLYTNVPLNATYGRPFHEVASRIFVGTHKPPRSRQWPPTSPFLPPNRSSFSFHPLPFGGPEGKDRGVARGEPATRGCATHSGGKIQKPIFASIDQTPSDYSCVRSSFFDHPSFRRRASSSVPRPRFFSLSLSPSFFFLHVQIPWTTVKGSFENIAGR